jgi:MFS transporter, DHA3 family, macrolide efflux protein
MKCWMNKNLVLLFSGQLVSQVGDRFYMLALSFWVLKTTGSPAKMGIVLACSLIPSLLLGLVSGAFIDRYSRKAIIVGTDLIRGLIIGGVAAAYILDELSFSIIIISQVLLSVNAAFFDPAVPAIIPGIVKTEDLSRANSMTELIRGIASIAGPVLGGVVVAVFGYSFAFVFNGISFILSAFFESFMELPEVIQSKDGGKFTFKSIKQDIIEGYRYIAADSALMVILVMVALIHFFVGSVEVVLPVLADGLNGDGAQNLGFLQAAFGIGAVITALAISLLNIANKEDRLLFGSIFLIGVGYCTMAVLGLAGIVGIPLFLLVFLLMGAFVILAATCFRSIIQRSIDEHMAGRVFGVVSSICTGTIPLAMLIYGFLVTYIDMNQLVLTSGLLILPITIGFYRRYIKTIKIKQGD